MPALQTFMNITEFLERKLVLQGKASTCDAEDSGSIPGLGRSPGEENGNPLQYSFWKIPWTEEPVGYSPWCRKELDTTE